MKFYVIAILYGGNWGTEKQLSQNHYLRPVFLSDIKTQKHL